MSKPRVLVYLDNCLASDITSGRTGDRYEETRYFWKKVTAPSGKYRGVISAYVLQESRAGKNASRIAAREKLYRGMRSLPSSSSCAHLAHNIRVALKWSDDRHLDALHVAAASYHGIPYLVTWDKGMIGRNEQDIRFYLQNHRKFVPIITTPSDFLSRSNPPRLPVGANTVGVREVRAIRRDLIRRAGGSEKRLLQILASYGT